MVLRHLKPLQVLLLDEITVDLDVVTRMDLLDFFKEECEQVKSGCVISCGLSCLSLHNMKCSPQREATIVYATHIFDGMETWATDVAYIQEGELRKSAKYSDIEELKGAKNLLSVVESWLRSEVKLPKKEQPPASEAATQPRRSSPFDGSPFRSSRHMAYYR
jgi:CCR4-NOT complex subunit CAF16